LNLSLSAQVGWACDLAEGKINLIASRFLNHVHAGTRSLRFWQKDGQLPTCNLGYDVGTPHERLSHPSHISKYMRSHLTLVISVASLKFSISITTSEKGRA
jgi:hypothetical protein